jgi:hypothetical protein
MPGKRPTKKGSFGGHFDELVKHFPEDKPAKGDRSSHGREPGPTDVHDRLFESAWRQAREARALRR